MAFWNRGALLPWPLNNNNNNNNIANNNNNNIGVGGVGGGAGAAPHAVANPVARAAAAAAMRVRRGVRGVVARRGHSDNTSTAREHDDVGDDLRVTVGEEVADRFARLRSNQHLAPRLKRTGSVDIERSATLAEERDAMERALVDRFVSCMENAVGDGIDGQATAAAEAGMLQELLAWADRVRQEREKNAEARAFLVARRAELVQKEAALSAASRHIGEAATQIALPPPPRWSSRFDQ